MRHERMFYLLFALSLTASLFLSTTLVGCRTIKGNGPAATDSTRGKDSENIEISYYDIGINHDAQPDKRLYLFSLDQEQYTLAVDFPEDNASGETEPSAPPEKIDLQEIDLWGLNIEGPPGSPEVQQGWENLEVYYYHADINDDNRPDKGLYLFFSDEWKYVVPVDLPMDENQVQPATTMRCDAEVPCQDVYVNGRRKIHVKLSGPYFVMSSSGPAIPGVTVPQDSSGMSGTGSTLRGSSGSGASTGQEPRKLTPEEAERLYREGKLTAGGYFQEPGAKGFNGWYQKPGDTAYWEQRLQSLPDTPRTPFDPNAPIASAGGKSLRELRAMTPRQRLEFLRNAKADVAIFLVASGIIGREDANMLTYGEFMAAWFNKSGPGWYALTHQYPSREWLQEFGAQQETNLMIVGTVFNIEMALLTAGVSTGASSAAQGWTATQRAGFAAGRQAARAVGYPPPQVTSRIIQLFRANPPRSAADWSHLFNLMKSVWASSGRAGNFTRFAQWSWMVEKLAGGPFLERFIPALLIGGFGGLFLASAPEAAAKEGSSAQSAGTPARLTTRPGQRAGAGSVQGLQPGHIRVQFGDDPLDTADLEVREVTIGGKKGFFLRTGSGRATYWYEGDSLPTGGKIEVTRSSETERLGNIYSEKVQITILQSQGTSTVLEVDKELNPFGTTPVPAIPPRPPSATGVDMGPFGVQKDLGGQPGGQGPHTPPAGQKESGWHAEYHALRTTRTHTQSSRG